MSESLKPRWRIALTVNGIGYACSVLVLFLFAVNYNSNLLFTLCFILIGVLVVCFWLGLVNVKGITGLRVKVVPVHKGQSLEYSVEVADSGQREHLDLDVNNEAVVDVLRDQPQQWLVHSVACQRGIKKGGLLRVSSRWPLGLFKNSYNLLELPPVVVYPEAVSQSPPRITVEGDQAHQHNDADSLMGLREYQAGDNARRIDWRAMARHDQLQIKLFDGGSGDASVLLDWNEITDFPYEQRISSLCRWIIDYQKQGVEFGLRLPNFSVEPASSYTHLYACLHQLAIMPKVES